MDKISDGWLTAVSNVTLLSILVMTIIILSDIIMTSNVKDLKK